MSPWQSVHTTQSRNTGCAHLSVNSSIANILKIVTSCVEFVLDCTYKFSENMKQESNNCSI